MVGYTEELPITDADIACPVTFAVDEQLGIDRLTFLYRAEITFKKYENILCFQILGHKYRRREIFATS